jgi:hypothetical protein
VLFDDVALVIFDVTDSGETCLHVAAHALLVKVNARLRLSHEGSALLQRHEIFVRLCIDRVRIRIGLRRQIDLRAIHVEQAVRLAGRERGRFLAIDNVVWDTGHFRDECRCRPQPLESLETKHRAAKQTGFTAA